MKIPTIRLAIIGLVSSFYIYIVVWEYQFSPYIFMNHSWYQWLIFGPLCLLLFSALFLLSPRWLLLTMFGGLISWAMVYLAFFYFINPFTLGGYKEYGHPNGIFKIKYPRSWKIKYLGGDRSRVYICQYEGWPRYEWNYANNAIFIDCYNKADYDQKFSSLHRWHEKKLIKIGGQEVKVFCDYGGGSSFSGSQAYIKYESNDKIFFVGVDREWCADGWGEVFNPNAISSERLFKKAWPIIKSFELQV